MVTQVAGRQFPRMSAAKMGEYLEASANRRERILADQKFPATFKTAPYTSATRIISEALAAGAKAPDVLSDGLERLQTKVPTTSFLEVSQECSIRALNSFASLLPRLPLTDLTVAPLARPTIPLRIEEVSVSVTLAATTRRIVRGQRQVGGILLVFRQEQPLGVPAGKAISHLVHKAATAFRVGDELPLAQLCMAIDIMHGAFHVAPGSHKLIDRDIEAACREIADRWPFVQKRAA